MWLLLLAVVSGACYAVFCHYILTIDRRGIVLIMAVGGALVAMFEVPLQYAIAGLGVAPAVALLYTAPVTVAVAGHFILREKLTPLRIALAVGVMIGVWLTVNGEAADQSQPTASRLAGIVGGLIAAASYAGSAILGRYIVPRYGSRKMLY